MERSPINGIIMPAEYSFEKPIPSIITICLQRMLDTRWLKVYITCRKCWSVIYYYKKNRIVIKIRLQPIVKVIITMNFLQECPPRQNYRRHLSLSSSFSQDGPSFSFSQIISKFHRYHLSICIGLGGQEFMI